MSACPFAASLGLLQQCVHTLGRHNGLLQLTKLERDLNQRIDYTADVTHKRIQYPDLGSAEGTLTKLVKHSGQQQHID